ncbi:penicillin acylase family protein [Roseibaca sp. Y0-43]|uniref:penicillin acylase family protein n=1 Tax=Roseibaca sp. Y0-43 TaxID=2816854 RepID=UPI001D0C829C|nr:penicillin acylase family protein [Roseibaca sp. Y0-43]MCC1480186.1 penicillin acylase family protein [Roseibaca sp. Y0-43]
MFTLFRWLVRMFLGLALIALLALVGVYFFASRSLPDYDGRRVVEGISAPVEIVRNTHAVPHIFGVRDADVFFGLGYAHAQDRFWQMQMSRRMAQGRLSEMFGRSTLRVDELMRRLDLYTLSRDAVAAQDAPTQAALAAYADGVNAWLIEVNEGAQGRGAPEFFLFDAEMPLWQPADSIAILKLMAVQQNTQIAREVRRARLSLALEGTGLSGVLPDVMSDSAAMLPDYGRIFPGVPRGVISAPEADPFDMLPLPELRTASASFAAAPARAATDGALLAHSPQAPLSAPSMMYLARLELQSGGVIGATVPGVPVVLSGRSPNLGWGMGAAFVDDSDLFLEELNPADPTQYRTPEGWATFESRGSIIRIKDEDPVTLTLRWSQNGPVLSGGLFDLASVTPPGHVATLGWTALLPEDRSITALMGLMRAQTLDAAIAAGADFVAPAQNLMLAEPGRIAMQTIGRLPRRSADSLTQGHMPAPGWQAENRWLGTLPYSANPSFTDPEAGILLNTNNQLLDRPFPLHVGHDWGDSQRIERLGHLVQARSVHTRDSFIEAQLDTVSPAARALLPLVAANLWFSGDAAPEGTRAHTRQRALRLLAEWNGEMNEHLPEPLIYTAWMRALQERLIRDELGPLADEFTHMDPAFVARVFRDQQGAGAWCDIIQSSVTETCDDMALVALDDALLRLSERFGDNLESWRWGDAHIARHDHPVLRDASMLRFVVNIRQSTSGGDHTLNMGRAAGLGDEPFANVMGPVYRGVYDFVDPESSVFIISTGQSGHPLSRHYDDLGDLWRRGEYIPMTLDPDLARAGTIGVITLVPQ